MADTEQNVPVLDLDVCEPDLAPQNPTSQSPASTSVGGFAFPPQYHFPPFFTLQPNLTTRAAQLASWTELILDYASRSSPRLFRLTSSHTIFTNSVLNRALMPADAKEVLKYMVEHGRAAWFDTGSAHPRKSVDGRATNDGAEVWLYWHTPEEWAQMISTWVEESGQRSTVLTMYELIESDATKGQAFHGLPFNLANTAIQVLKRRGKAQTLGDGDDLGFKIF